MSVIGGNIGGSYGGSNALLNQRLAARSPDGARPAARNNGHDEPLSKLMDRIRQHLFARVDAFLLNNREDPKAQKQIRDMLAEIVRREAEGMSPGVRAALVDSLANDVLGYGPIQPLLADPAITEVMVNRYDQVYVEKKGVLQKVDIKFRDDEHVRNVIQKIVGPIGRRIDESSPMVDARLPDGSRVNAMIPPLAIDGANITIRKFGKKLSAADLVRLGAIRRRELSFLEACVRGRLNIIVSGGTGSGKTTLLNVLSSFIPAEERIVTIEDAAELQLQQEHVVRCEMRPPNMEGKGEITIRDLVKNALRMRPDRIIVGECRGGEALDMLQAMNTGHDGSLTTLHANSPRHAMSRLETLVMMAGQELPSRAIREQIAGAVDLVVQTARLRDGSRKVTSICEVGDVLPDGAIETRDLFTFKMEEDGEGGRIQGRLVPAGAVPGFLEKLEWRGVRIDPAIFSAAEAPGGDDDDAPESEEGDA